MKFKPTKGVARGEERVVNNHTRVTPQPTAVTRGAGGKPVAPSKPVPPEVEKEEDKMLGLGDTGQGRGIGQIAIILLGAVVLVLLLKKG